jgi:FkbM family methyltransferase
MTPVERALSALRPLLSERLMERIRNNLPSRKPQLWERLPHALLRRAELAWRARFDSRSAARSVIVSLPGVGAVMELAPRGGILDLTVFLFGVWEISCTRFVQSVLEPGMTVIDVGANSGYYTLLAARLVGSRGHVHAFEPVAGPFERLRRNLALNGVRNATIKRAAVASSWGRATVYPSAVDNNDGLGSLLPGHGRSAVGQKVPVISLDQVVSEFREGQVHLIKVDVEGAEAQVFAGARTLLGSPNAPVLLFESFDVAPVIKSLVRFGYEVRHLHYSLATGLEFPRVGDAFDNLFSAYEAPNYVALKPSGRLGSFQEFSTRSKRRIPTVLRLLATLA